MSSSIRIATMSIKLVMRTKAALFFTFLFPLIFLFVYAGILAKGKPTEVLYMFGPVLTLSIMGSAFWGLGVQSVMQRERGSLRRYRLAPIGPGSIVVGSLLANYLLQLPSAGLLVACAVLVFHMPLQINLFTLLALVTIGAFAFAGFGLTIASVANTMQEAQVYNNVVWFALLFLSGTTLPLPMLPTWVQRVAAFLPATYLVSSLQSIMLGGKSLFDYRTEMLALLVAGTFGLLFAWKLFRWEKEEKISKRAKLISLAFVLPFLITGVWMNRYGNLRKTWEHTYSLIGESSADAAEHAFTAETFLLNDFESSREDELLKTWQVVTDPSAAGRSVGEVEIISPGAGGTGHALRFKGHAESAGRPGSGYVEARYGVRLPATVHGMRGIQLEIRGSDHLLQIGVSSPDPAVPASVLSFVPDLTWQSVRLPAAWLTNPSLVPQHGPLALELHVQGGSGNFEFDIDEIRLYSSEVSNNKNEAGGQMP